MNIAYNNRWTGTIIEEHLKNLETLLSLTLMGIYQGYVKISLDGLDHIIPAFSKRTSSHFKSRKKRVYKITGIGWTAALNLVDIQRYNLRDLSRFYGNNYISLDNLYTIHFVPNILTAATESEIEWHQKKILKIT